MLCMAKTIRVSEETHERLKARGSKGETFEEIIADLLERNEK